MTGGPLPTSDDLAAFLVQALGAVAFPADERGGVYRVGDGRRVAALGLALEPWPGLADWAAEERVDALFLHRPWRLTPSLLPSDVAVLWSHLPFDERLTTGDNVRLARVLGFGAREPFGVRDARPLGMIGDVAAEPVGEAAARISAVFGGHESLLVPDSAAPVGRIAVVGAMTDALVREAAARGAGLYVTGQFRQPARSAVSETGIAVLATGHARAEEWGLRTLSSMVAERWPAVRTPLGSR